MCSLIHLKWRSNSFRLHKISPSLMVQMLFSTNSSGPLAQTSERLEIPAYLNHNLALRSVSLFVCVVQ